MDDAYWMGRALEVAKLGAAAGEVPVGCVIVGHPQEGAAPAELAACANGPIGLSDPTAHAEVRALRTAAQTMGNYRLVGTCVYVTLEPCMMCVGAMVHARIERLVFGAREPKAGAVCSHPLLAEPWLNHSIEVREGVGAAQSTAMLQAFFRARR